jgi:uncharacterized peroxidase-related enzyme
MWIDFISHSESTGRLRVLYDRVAGRNGTVDNILQAHSLRPHTLTGHMALYKSVLHHASNEQPTWFLETIGVFVSHLNGCSYCFDHHLAGLTRLVGQSRAEEIALAVRSGEFARAFTAAQVSALRYTEQLTLRPADIKESAIKEMRAKGLSDGDILEINQVVAYFAYANRMVNGLGVTTEGDELGLSPSADDPESWGHE